MNCLDEHIQFTFGKENCYKLSFFDISVFSEKYITVYHKLFLVSLPSHQFSSDLTNLNLADFNTYVYLDLNIRSSNNLLQLELNYIKSDLII